ncbi:hypothetical protein LCGC14_2624980, partial [marine sediment metagenome]
MKGKTALLLIAGLFSVMFLVSAEWERPSNIAYGEMFIENNTVTTVIETKGAWANITTGATVGTFKRVAYFNGTLTAEIQGLYDVSYSISFSDGNNIEFESAIGVNSLNQTNCHTSRTIGAGGDVGTVAATCFVRLASSDE